MSKNIQIRIPEPCHENWQHMTPTEQGRFCGSCQKTVVDFTAMTDKEILDYFSKAAQPTCGRFSGDQLNKDLQPTVIKKRFTWAYVWNVVLATFLLTKAHAQEEPVKKSPEVHLPDISPRVGTVAVVEKAVMQRELKGMVRDSATGQPLTGATIIIKGTSKGTNTDTSGNFRLMSDYGEPIELMVSSIGYNSQQLRMDNRKDWRNIQVNMVPALTTLMGDFVVVEKKPKKKHRKKR